MLKLPFILLCSSAYWVNKSTKTSAGPLENSHIAFSVTRASLFTISSFDLFLLHSVSCNRAAEQGVALSVYNCEVICFLFHRGVCLLDGYSRNYAAVEDL